MGSTFFFFFWKVLVSFSENWCFRPQSGYQGYSLLLSYYFQCLFFFNYLFLYFWLGWVFIASCRLSPVAARRGYSQVVVLWLLMAATSLVAEHRLWGPQASVVVAHGLNSCSPGSRAWAQYLGCTGLVAPWHVGSSQPGEQTYVSCIGRQILYHWATRAVLFPVPLSGQFTLTLSI